MFRLKNEVMPFIFVIVALVLSIFSISYANDPTIAWDSNADWNGGTHYNTSAYSGDLILANVSPSEFYDSGYYISNVTTSAAPITSVAASWAASGVNWTQTSRDDFANGTQNQLDIDTSPGDIVLATNSYEDFYKDVMAYAESSEPDSGWGGGCIFRSYDGISRSFLKFNLSSYNFGIVTAASIYLYFTSGPRLEFEIRKVSDDSWTRWVTWNTQPAYGDVLATAFTPSPTFLPTWRDYVITSYAQNQIGSDKVLSFALKLRTETTQSTSANRCGDSYLRIYFDHYATSGTFSSQVKDFTSPQLLKAAYITGTYPSGTSALLSAEYSNDNTTWTLLGQQTYNTSGTGVLDFADVTARYVRWNVTLQTSDWTITPVVSDVKIDGYLPITIEISANNGSTWHLAQNGSTINTASDASNTKLIFRANLSTPDSTQTPQLHNIALSYYTVAPIVIKDVTQTPPHPIETESIIISANISSIAGPITSAKLSYSVNGAPYANATMSPVSGLWQATIGPYLEGTTINYRIWTQDNSGNTLQTADFSTRVYGLNISLTIPPLVAQGQNVTVSGVLRYSDSAVAAARLVDLTFSNGSAQIFSTSIVTDAAGAFSYVYTISAAYDIFKVRAQSGGASAETQAAVGAILAFGKSIPTKENVVVTKYPVVIVDRFGRLTQGYFRIATWLAGTSIG